ncbi:MAG: mechanosensitive ion channel [Anaerolineae bacterium]|nr:mechanosensitive ion channel [Anaerolineae bacterium]
MTDTILAYLRLLSNEIITRQLIAFGLVLVVSWIIQFLLRRLLARFESRFEQIPRTRHLLTVLQFVLWPALARLFGQLALLVFTERVWYAGILAWAVSFITLWLFYRLIVALLHVTLSPEQADVVRRKIVLPLTGIAALLQGLGLMDDVLRWSVTPRADLQVTVGSVITGLVTLAIFYVLAQAVEQYLARSFFPQVKANRALAQALSRLTSYAVVIFGAIMALVAIGINFTTVAVIAGGLSVGIGFGLQEIASNFISGFILMFERSIGPGDVLRVDDTLGVVRRINVRSMIIRTQDNIELIVPNSKFLTETVTNFTRTQDLVRVRVSVGVSYRSDPRQVERILLETADHPRVLTRPAPAVQFTDFGESSLNFDLLVWTDDAARVVPLASDLRFKIWEALKAHHIEIPFPQRDLHLRSGVPWQQFASSPSPQANQKKHNKQAQSDQEGL